MPKVYLVNLKNAENKIFTTTNATIIEEEEHVENIPVNSTSTSNLTDINDDQESMVISESTSTSENQLDDNSCSNTKVAEEDSAKKFEDKKSYTQDSISLIEDNIKDIIETDIVVTNLTDDFTDSKDDEQCKSYPNTYSPKINCDKSVNEISIPLASNILTPEPPKLSNTSSPKITILTQKRPSSTYLTKLPTPKLKTQTKHEQKFNANGEDEAGREKLEAAGENGQEELAAAALPTHINNVESRPLTLPSAMELKSVLLGSPEGQFFKEWKESEIFVSADVFQAAESGISGVLAVVQGFVTKEMTFGRVRDKEVAFVLAISEILWQSGLKSQACLAICGDEERLVGCGRYRRDGITEAMVLLHFNSIDDTKAAVERHVGQLKGPGGLLLLVASLVLSKGLDEFRGRPPLLSRANVSLVNLTLTGRLDMREAKQRAEIGLLSLAEHYGHIKVPSCLKTPRWPIWVVELGPDKYSVILSANPKLVADWRAELAFRLQIFDAEGVKSAAITTGGELNDEEEKTASYLEMTIRTKWSGAQIQWIPK